MSTPNRDLEIASQIELKPIDEIAARLGLTPHDLIHYGKHKAKVEMPAIRRVLESKSQNGHLILVSAITPTPAGEGKTTMSIGLAQGLNHLGKKVSVALREPSLGPCLGMKGGAAGGGRSQVLPMEDINLHFTGDLHAVTSAHNFISAALDNHLHFSDGHAVSPRRILWKRVIDMNDRSLRDIAIGLGGVINGVPRESGFEITAASEVMAILCLSLGYSDLKKRLGNILLGFTREREPFRVRDLGIAGAATALLKDALLPNLVQSIEGVPAFVHGGPFANIAQGTNTILSTKLALKLSDYVVTEAGFGFDLGAEKYFNIVSRYAGWSPSLVVLVATVRALKMHGGVAKTALDEPNPDAILQGRENLEKHLENVRAFGMEPVVAINRFVRDSDAELESIRQICQQSGARCAIVNSWEEGGGGATEIAEQVLEVTAQNPPPYRPLYDLAMPVEEKIRTVAQQIYGANDVDILARARTNLRMISKYGFDKLPICMAKTQNSLSDDPKAAGRPRGFILTVREILVSAGAGFLVPLTGTIVRMPGLPKVLLSAGIDIDEEGNIEGLF